MSANTSLRVTELDYEEIRTNLKDFLRSQDRFSDFDFEGSGMSVLLDLLAYNTHYMAYHLNMVGNEMFLDSAQLRESLISHSKLLGYRPTSRLGAEAKVNIKVTPGNVEDQNINSITLARGVNFLSDPIDGVSYNFVTLNSNTATKVNGSFSFANVVIRQGEYISTNYLVVPDNTKRQFIIPSANVDTTSIQVSIRESVVNSYSEIYTLSQDITEIQSDSKVFFLEETPFANSTYMLYFGDGVLGKRPKDGNMIDITYLDTKGFFANKANQFTLIDSIDGFSANVSVTSTQRASGGSEKEPIESIRFRAPLFYTTQNRAVSINDYKSILSKDYQNIRSISVWGGEENDPVVYGRVYISLNPVENYFISLDEKERIKNEIMKNRSILTVTPELVDPEYVYLMINVICDYDSDKTSLDVTEIDSLFRAAIDDYKDQYLNQFNTTFRLSKLETILNTVDNSILGVDAFVYLQKRITITPGISKTYIFDYSVPLLKGTIKTGLYSFPAISVKDNEGISRLIYIEEVSESFTGIDRIDIVSGGTGYTSTPEVIITGDGSGAQARANIVNGVLTEIEIINRGTGYTTAFVSFSTGNAIALPILENRNGTLRSFYYLTTGEKVIMNPSFGKIDYLKGKIVFPDLNVESVKENGFYDENILTINIQPETNIITTKRNQILTLDSNDPSSIKTTIRSGNR